MKNLKNSKKTSGISLVALIVTIIVLIILTAAVIVTFMEGGIIEKAKEAVFKSDIRTYQEILAVKNAENMINLATGNGEGSELNSTEVKDIIPEFKEEYKDLIAISNGEIVLGSRTEDPYSIWLSELGIGAGKNNNQGTTLASIAEVGHYVNYYVPAAKQGSYNTKTTNGDETSWIFNDGDGDESYDSGEEEIGYQDIMWRVLKKDENTVTLVSAEPVENICLYGKKGFRYGTERLDEICEAVYGGRNLNIEDVNEMLKMEPLPYYSDEKFNKIEMEYGATLGDALENYDGEVFGFDMPDNNEYKLVYSYNKSDCLNVTEAIKNIVFTTNEYWLSSHGVNFFVQGCNWEFYYITEDRLQTEPMYDSNTSYEQEYQFAHGIRPVVTLNGNTKISDTNTGDGSSAANAWQLK